jgi:uncharacterized membrane protein
MAEKKVSKYTNLEPNVAAALAYLITPFTGIAFFLLEKDDKFVRFHAFQSILFGVISYAAWVIATSLVVLVIGVFLVPVVSIAAFIYYALLMWKAYNGEFYELPVLGKIAKEQAHK